MSSIPRFTSGQLQALDRYFGPSSKNWNRIPSHSCIWKNCLTLLKKHCQQHTHASSPVSAIARKSLPLLQQKSIEDARRFFRDHLIIGVHAIPQRIQRFISKMDINQQGQYVCLVLSNPTASLYCDLQITGASKLKKMDVFVEIDLLVEETVSTDALFQKYSAKGYEFLSETVSARCTSQVPIPLHTYAVWKTIDSTIKRAFLTKLNAIKKRTAQNRERERTSCLWRYAFLASALLVALVFLRVRRFITFFH